MNSSLNADRTLGDLLFELEDATEPKFLIAVSDDPIQTEDLQNRIVRSQQAQSKRVVNFTASTLQSNLLNHLHRVSQFGTVHAIQITDLSAEPQRLKQVFAQLNFHRDALSRLKVPLVIWVSTSALQALINVAPDFWSRRGAVYYFTTTPIEQLLLKMFSSGSHPGSTDGDRTVSQALESILSSEAKLRECLKNHKFRLREADQLISRIKNGIDCLVAACKRHKEIEIALWLWNISNLDRNLQRWLDTLEPESKNFYESLYADRNEVLVDMATHVPRLLASYSEEFDRGIQSNEIVSLASLFTEAAIGKLNEMARDLSAAAHLDLEEVAGVLGESPYEDSEDLTTSIFREAAADELEHWLTGDTKRRPKIFTPSEGEVLRALYAADGNIQALARKFHLTNSQAANISSRLEEKVRLFLGAVVLPVPKLR